MANVELRGVRKTYPGGVDAVCDVDLTIADGSFVVLVGPSGCGKSTTLRMIAGLEDITAGEIAIGGRVVNDVHPKDRDIAMVFQNYALYPHMTVGKNMAFALKLRKIPAAEPASPAPQTAGAALAITVEVVEPLGEQMDVHGRAPAGTKITARVTATNDLAIGAQATFQVDTAKLRLFEPGELGRCLTVAPAEANEPVST